jgi:hypothetical protein
MQMLHSKHSKSAMLRFAQNLNAKRHRQARLINTFRALSPFGDQWSSTWTHICDSLAWKVPIEASYTRSLPWRCNPTVCWGSVSWILIKMNQWDEPAGDDERVTNRDLYEVLGVPKDATDSQLKRAYHKLAMWACENSSENTWMLTCNHSENPSLDHKYADSRGTNHAYTHRHMHSWWESYDLILIHAHTLFQGPSPRQACKQPRWIRADIQGDRLCIQGMYACSQKFVRSDTFSPVHAEQEYKRVHAERQHMRARAKIRRTQMPLHKHVQNEQ